MRQGSSLIRLDSLKESPRPHGGQEIGKSGFDSQHLHIYVTLGLVATASKVGLISRYTTATCNQRPEKRDSGGVHLLPIGSLSIAEGRGGQNQISVGSTRLHIDKSYKVCYSVSRIFNSLKFVNEVS